MATKLESQRITLRSIIIGVVGCIVLTAVSMYTALKLGALPWPIVFAAIIALLFLRLCGSRSLHEANIAHTMMTAGSMAAGGLAFTIPGIFILGAGEITISHMLLAALAGTFLGLAATLLFRQKFIEDEPMEYPIGTAAAQTLIGGDRGGRTALAVFIPMALAAAYAWLRDRLAALPALFFANVRIPGMTFGLYNSPMLVAVGFLIGATAMITWFAGALIGDFGIVVGGTAAGLWDADTGAGIKSSLGMGLMIGGGVAVVARTLLSRTHIKGSTAKNSKAKAKKAAKNAPETIGVIFSADTSGNGAIPGALAPTPTSFAAGIANPKTARIIVLTFTALAFLLCLALRLNVVTSLIIIAMVWVTAVMAIICVGHTGIDPMEVFGLIVMLLAAAASPTMPVVSMFFVAAIIAVACGLVGDVMNDMHAGHVLKTSPKHQFIAQATGGIIGAVVSAFTLYLLVQAYGTDAFGVGKYFISTQASTVALLVSGIPNIPAFLAGLALGVGLYFAKVPTVMLGLGVYLPFFMSFCAALGGLARLIFDRFAARKQTGEERTSAQNTATLICSGVLGGESICGVIIAFLAIAGI